MTQTYLLTGDDVRWLDRIHRGMEQHGLSDHDDFDRLGTIIAKLKGEHFSLEEKRSPASPPMPVCTVDQPGRPSAGFRAFKGTFFIAIDERERTDEDDEPLGAEPVTLPALTKWLDEAVVLDMNEEVGNPLGWQSTELHYSTLTEMSPEELAYYYGRTG